MLSQNLHTSALAQLMGSEKYSDLKLVCEGHEFRVHKAIVCPQSPVLAAACDGAFQEAETNTVKIEEHNVGAVKRMVEFLYTKAYGDPTEERGSEAVSGSGTTIHDSSSLPLTKASTAEILLGHVRVNAVADYYDIPQLKELANTKIQHIIETNWSPHGFSEVVKEVFNSTADRELREIMSLTVTAHIEELLEFEDFAELDVMGDFAIGIIRNMFATYKADESLTSRELRDMKHRLQSLEVDYSSERSAHEHEASRANRISENIDHCLEILSKTRSCRNARCDADFTCYVERRGPIYEPQYTLRCAKCHCRHKNIR